MGHALTMTHVTRSVLTIPSGARNVDESDSDRRHRSFMETTEEKIRGPRCWCQAGTATDDTGHYWRPGEYEMAMIYDRCTRGL